MQKAINVAPATFVMWPADDLHMGEILNGDTSSDLNWVLAMIISISPTTTSARILGTNFEDETVLAGSFVRFDTPSVFVVPMGINREAAEAHIDKLGNFSEPCIVRVEEQQEEASTTTFKKTGEIIARGYLDHLDGDRRLCRDMTQSSKRGAILGPVWRLTKGRELEVAG